MWSHTLSNADIEANSIEFTGHWTKLPVFKLGVEQLLIFLKSTFMWWKSSRSRLVADDVINEQISLELWQTPCAQLWNMTQRCPHDYCTYNSLFLSVLSSLGRYISHRFLLALNQIQINSTVKITFIWMNALVRAIACELILPAASLY